MTARVRVSLGAVLLAGATALACGGAAEKGPAAPQPAGSSAPDPGGVAPKRPDEPPAPTEESGRRERQAAGKKAAGDLDVARRELDEAGGDCKAACRALGSMDRAAGALCKLSETSDEHTRCDEAKGALYKARDRVRAACRECPGGPSVERSAPVPSR